jgi:hypothetical protein
MEVAMIRRIVPFAATATCERCGRQLIWVPNGRGGWRLHSHPDDCLSSKRWSGDALLYFGTEGVPARRERLN